MINNVNVYGLGESVIASKYPMSVNISSLNSAITPTVKKLAQCSKGTGHDNFLNGIIVQFDLDKAYIKYVDQRIIDIMKDKVDTYNKLMLSIKEAKEKGQPTTNMQEYAKIMYLEILYSNPCGFILTARMTTNYRQLKTIYAQRKNHRLPEWREFCKWIETLPYAKELITGGENE